jgi:hypothetical protein
MPWFTEKTTGLGDILVWSMLMRHVPLNGLCASDDAGAHKVRMRNSAQAMSRPILFI